MFSRNNDNVCTAASLSVLANAVRSLTRR